MTNPAIAVKDITVRFGESVALLHSQLSEGEHLELERLELLVEVPASPHPAG
jgi:hypothetical protein